MTLELKNTISVAVSAAIGGLLNYAVAALSTKVPDDGQAWKTFGIGALVAVLVAVKHLYDQSPSVTKEKS